MSHELTDDDRKQAAIDWLNKLLGLIETGEAEPIEMSWEMDTEGVNLDGYSLTRLPTGIERMGFVYRRKHGKW